ncbi:MAG TPA: ferredoxin [Jatrophihabitans sp.]|nr:ferredoxin [Jatrophihabitans sp.]
MSEVRVTVDRDRCVGSGMCALTAPEVFDQDGVGLVMLLAPRPADVLAGMVRAAADLCPARAIAVHRGDRPE